MKLPSKIISYNESTIGKFVSIIVEIQKYDATLFSLYKKTEKYFLNIEEFIDTLDCLFALNKIKFIEATGVLHYVA